VADVLELVLAKQEREHHATTEHTAGDMLVGVRSVLALVFALGCGRVEFDPQPRAVDAQPDAGPLIHSGTPRVLSFGEGPFWAHNSLIAWLSANTQSVMSAGSNATITPALLANVDVVLTRSISRTFAPDESAALYEFVAAGHGLFALTGYSGFVPENEQFTSLMVAFDASAPGLAGGGQVTELSPHPINAGLVQLPYDGGFEIREPAGAAQLGRLNGRVVGAAWQVGLGRVIVWGDDWVQFDDYWVADMLAMFWAQAFAWVWPTS
jgi:hypothetical protein